jgi:ribokinase
MAEVLVVGSSNTDLVCRTERIPRPGETVRGASFASYPGGKGANQAVAAARAGARVRFVGAVGNDDMGAQRLAELRAEGIDVTGVRIVDGVPSGVAAIAVDDAGENSIVIVPGANDAILPEHAIAAVEQFSYDVLSLTLEIPLAVVAASFDANDRRSPAVLNAAPYHPDVAGLLNAVDVLVCNELEAGELLGALVTAGNALGAGDAIRQRGAAAVVITLGASGAALIANDARGIVPAPVVDVLDTTGAGDAFCGCLAAWLANRASLFDAVRAGVCAGALAVGRAGAQPSLPMRVAIVERMRRHAFA